MVREVLVLQCVGQELVGGCSAEVALLGSPDDRFNKMVMLIVLDNKMANEPCDVRPRGV